MVFHLIAEAYISSRLRLVPQQLTKVIRAAYFMLHKKLLKHTPPPQANTHKITKLLLFFAPYQKFFIFIVIYYFTTTAWFIVRKILPCFNSENCVWGVIFD